MAINRMGFCIEDNHQGRNLLSYSGLTTKTLHCIVNWTPKKVHKTEFIYTIISSTVAV